MTIPFPTLSACTRVPSGPRSTQSSRPTALPAQARHATPTDGELARRALKGSSPAFQALLERHLEHLRRVIAHRLGNPEDVRDVLQDTQLSVWRGLATYDADLPFEAWATCIALNKCRDWARRKAVRIRLAADARAQASLWGLPLHAPAAEELLIEQETARHLQEGIQRLPSQLREPLLLTTLNGLSHVQAGEELGLTSKAIENRVRRARARLAQTLNP